MGDVIHLKPTDAPEPPCDVEPVQGPSIGTPHADALDHFHRFYAPLRVFRRALGYCCKKYGADDMLSELRTQIRMIDGGSGDQT